MSSPDINAPRSTAAYKATFPFYSGIVFLVSINFPGLLELPGGIPGAMAVMLLGFPYWFRAACLRDGPIFDAAAQSGLAIILSCVVFLIAWAFLSAIGSELPFRAGRGIASLAGAFAVYMLVLGTVTTARMDTYLAVASFSLAFTCFVTFVGYIVPPLHDLLLGGDRAAGFFKNANQFGMAISTLLPVAAACFFAGRGRRLRWGLCFVFLFLGLMLSGSKMNLLLLAATTGAMLVTAAYVFHAGRRRAVILVASVASYILLVLFGFFLLEILNPRAATILTRFFSPELEVQSLQSRSLLWQESMDQFMANPILGQGASQPLDLVERGRPVTHSHNVFLDFARTMGLPGLTGFLIMAGTAAILSIGAIRAALISKSAPPCVRIVTIGLAVGTLSYLASNVSSDSMGPSTSPFFWVVFFLCLASRRRLYPT